VRDCECVSVGDKLAKESYIYMHMYVQPLSVCMTSLCVTSFICEFVVCAWREVYLEGKNA